MDYSHKNFTGQSFIERTTSDGETVILNGQTITGSCFSHEKPDAHIFPDDMTGVTFINCNLDNCFIPAGNTVVGGSQRRFIVQDDGFDWIIDENNQPMEKL